MMFWSFQMKQQPMPNVTATSQGQMEAQTQNNNSYCVFWGYGLET